MIKQEIQTPAYQNIYNDYEMYIKAKGYKGFKNKVFQSPVKQFLIWMENYGITNIKEITTVAMMVYYTYLIERPSRRKVGTLAESTIKLHLLSISMFVENLLKTEALLKAFHIPKHGGHYQDARNYLTVDEIKILYQYTENNMEKALLAIAYGCGLRHSEVENLNTADIQLSRGTVIVRNGKGDKRREVPMSNTVLNDVKAYLTEYRYTLLGKQHNSAFFINLKGSRMKGKTLNKNLKKIITRTNNQTIINKEITLHCLRHSIAHHLMKNNAGIDFIKGFLGHSFINTSYIYAIKNKH